MIKTQKQGALEYLTSDNITVPHCFTTRFGGVSEGSQASLNLAIGRGDSRENVEANLRILGSALGFAPEKLVMTRQIHSDIVRVVSDRDCQGFFHKEYPECDALITNTPGVTLLVFTADCTPILFYDPVTGAVGAAHAGWRGTAQDIAGKTVAAMAENFGCHAENIRCAIGPNLGKCHFATDGDVPHALIGTFGREALSYIEKRGDKFYPDLKAINALALIRRGVTDIEVSDSCTWCESERFWSHRVTKGDRGSQGALITCTGK